MASARKIAKEAGVSIGTVSRVLNNKPGVGDETRRRVLEVAQGLNYAPTKRMPLPLVNITHLGLLVRPLTEDLTANPFYADVYHGVEQACREMRINLALSSLDLVEGRVRTLPALIGDERIGGLILVGAIAPAAVERLVEASQLPVVLVDNQLPGSPWDSVMLDNFAGVAAATARLLELGHREIVCIRGPDHPSVIERHRGYLTTMAQANLATVAVQVADLTAHDGEQAVAEVMRRYPGATALVCANDLVALGAMHGLARAGYRIPEDVSVVGFDDIAIAGLSNPRLTTVRVNRTAFGRLAFDILLGRINQPQRPPVHCTLGVMLVERASTSVARRQVVPSVDAASRHL